MEQKTLLIVEDEAKVRESLRTILGSAGYRVVFADTVEVAKHLMNQEKPDLMILDVNLPDGTGLDVCRHARASRDFASTPVIVMTGQGEFDDKTEGFEAGADQYLVKPVPPQELVLWVGALLRRVEYDQGGAGVTKTSDVEADPKAYTLRFKGALVEKLTVKEFELFYFLLSKRPQVLSRKFILTKLWHTVAVDHLVDQHLLRLRRKLPPELAARLQSVPGKGFRYFE